MKNGNSKYGKFLAVKAFQYIIALFMVGMLTACGGVTMKLEVAINTPAKSDTADKNTISAYELHKILTDHFGYVNIKLSDAEYSLPDNTSLALLQSSGYCGKDNAGAGNKGWGCDDYAIAAMVQMRNYAFGTMYVAAEGGPIRVMNVLVNNSKEVVYWEPQQCQYYLGQFDKPEFILF